MLVVPRDIEGLPILFQPEWPAAFTRDGSESVCGVDLPDACNRREFEAGLAGLRKKFERARSDYRMIGNDLGGLEVTLQICILHKLHVPEIGKSFTSG